MVSIVLLLVFINVTIVIKGSKLISIRVFFEVVHSFLRLDIRKLVSLGIIELPDLLMSLVGLLNHLDPALVKHVSHEKESSNHSKYNDSCNDDECSGRCSFII